MKSQVSYQFGETTTNVTIERNDDHFQITVGDNIYNVTVGLSRPNLLHFTIDGQQVQAYIARRESNRYVAINGDTWKLERPAPEQARRRGPGAEAGAGSGRLEAAMPGLVLDVLAAEGEAVERGQTLVLLEAMKMELRVAAPFAGRVAQIQCAAGQVVERGQLLIELERGES